jgi:hypothetical protein
MKIACANALAMLAREDVPDEVAAAYLRPFLGSREHIHGIERYCLWLVEAAPGDIRRSPELRTRVQAVQAARSSSTRAATRSLADTPALFGEIRQPSSRYLIVPSTSSSTRHYIPVALVEPEVVASNATLTIDNADLTTFGMLSSGAFTAWTATVGGRMKSDFRISAEIVYNNFPWPELSDDQRSELSKFAQQVIDVRASIEDATLADLYDPLGMPPALVKAHRELDRCVLSTYGLSAGATDAELLKALFTRYEELLEERA